MKRTTTVLTGLLVVVMMSGCASYLAVKCNQAERQNTAIRLAAENGRAMATVDLLAIGPEYWSAWGAHPWLMGGATLVDSATTYFVGREIKEAIEDDTPSDSGSPLPSGSTLNVQGDFFFIGRDGSISSTRDQSVGTGE